MRKKKMNLSDFKKVKEDFLKQSRQVLAGEFKEFFDKYPAIDAVRWTQYTPHFNDGDVCEFSRYGFDARCGGNAKNASEPGDEELISGHQADEDGFYEYWDVDDKTTLGKALKELNKQFSGADDVFKSAFGDGVQVVATRRGFTVEDYEHD